MDLGYFLRRNAVPIAVGTVTGIGVFYFTKSSDRSSECAHYMNLGEGILRDVQLIFRFGWSVAAGGAAGYVTRKVIDYFSGGRPLVERPVADSNERFLSFNPKDHLWV